MILSNTTILTIPERFYPGIQMNRPKQQSLSHVFGNQLSLE